MREINLKNKKFGKLLVLNKSNKKGNNGQAYWICICDCGKEHVVSGESLRSGRSKSCGCLRKNPPNKENNRVVAIWKQLYNSTIIKRSKKQGYVSNISFSKFKEMSQDKCFYCGLEHSNIATDKSYNGVKASTVVVKYNGIDRVNSELGYSVNNTVTCCKYCNIAKNIMTKDEFMRFIKRVYEYNFKSQPQ